jgi:NADP-dependent 3-hydroxy acid dehydrogenase YdfG
MRAGDGRDHAINITGAERGMGVDIAKAALGAGHPVVVTGRNTEAVREALGEADDLLVVALDITAVDELEPHATGS